MRRWFAGLVPLALAACVVDGGAGGVPAPVRSVRDVFADAPSPGAWASRAPSPQATATPRRWRTDRPLDVVLAGPGYLVASTRAQPRDWPDLTFVRGAEAKLVFEAEAQPAADGVSAPVSGPGSWTLRLPDGRYLLGFELTDDPDRAPPRETRSGGYSGTFEASSRGTRATFGALRLPTSTSLAPDARLDARGRLTIAGQAPVDDRGDPRFTYLAVVQVDRPEALKPAPAGGWLFDFDAGFAYAGLAGVPGTRPGDRPVGEANVLQPGWLLE